MLPAGAPAPRLQKKIGKYTIVGRIGRGGMGMVYRGRDETLEREVAVKTLTVEGTLDEESRKRFTIEAKAAAKLQHPNIVTVFELGEDRGLPFIAMELLPGVDLESLVRSGEAFLLEEKLDIVLQVLRGLQFAHDHGIIHRDVKPSNIRLLEDGTAKIMDFGIAKLSGTGVTKTGMMVGTVHYMSPEQIRGKPLDGRSDVFSVGVILYELLAGRRPFVGDTPTGVLYKIVHDPAPRIDTALAEGVAGLPELLDRALTKDRDLRPTAGGLAEDVTGVLRTLRARTAVPTGEIMDAVGSARRAIRTGRVDEAVQQLTVLVGRHPQSTEARRALRAAHREAQKRQGTPASETETFPELEVTYQPMPTRRTPDTALEPRTTVAPASPAAPPSPSTAFLPSAQVSGPSSGRVLLIGAAIAVVLVAAAGIGLVSRGRPGVAPRLAVRSTPPGAEVLVDGRDLGARTDGDLTLPDPALAQVVLTFRKAGYRDETRTVRLPVAQGEQVRVVLSPVSVPSLPVEVPVATEPAGAVVTLDGERVKGVTPLTLALDPSRDHRIALALDGHAPKEVRLGAGETPAEVRVSLEPAGPVGRVNVHSSYPVDVVWRGQTIARGQTAGQVSVPAGRQTLSLVSATYFLRLNANVEVPPNGAATLDAPPLGRINIRANPDNCQVFIDGGFVEYPPILDRAIAVGTHRVAFKWPEGEKQEETVDVGRTAPAYVMGRKD
jgi:predicted Ser/Thr protein kinase